VNNEREWKRQAGALGPDEEPGYGPPTLRQKAAFADAALGPYAEVTGLGYPEPEMSEAITDLLSDLRHLCDREGLDFATLDDRAQRHYEDEIDGEP